MNIPRPRSYFPERFAAPRTVRALDIGLALALAWGFGFGVGLDGTLGDAA